VRESVGWQVPIASNAASRTKKGEAFCLDAPLTGADKDEFKIFSQVVLYALRVALYGLRAVLCNLRVAPYGLRAVLCDLRVALYDLRVVLCNLRVALYGLRAVLYDLRKGLFLYLH
jgi:hypothetical protein